MKYLSGTFAYIKKNFWLPLAVMIVPSVIACFLSTPYWEVIFVTHFENYDPYVSFMATVTVMFGDSWKFLWPVVIISAFQIFGAALVMAAADMHFRTGKLSIKKPFKLINNTIFPVFLGVIIMCAMAIVWRVILFGFVLLVQAIGSAAGLNPGVALAIIAVIALIMFFLHVLIITPMLFWAPTMFIYGYRFRDAAAAAFKLISGKKVFRNIFLPLIVCAAIQLVVGFLSPHIAVTYAVNFVVMLATNMFVPVFVITSFYEISGLDRRDLKPYDIPLPAVPAQAKPAKKPSAEAPSGEQADAVPQKKPAKKPSDKQSAKKPADVPAKQAKKQSGKKADTKKQEAVTPADDAKGGEDVV